ncbi:MAG: hypothetical protein J3Q66DRAFT_340529 [Benniella sp.]|nr:MAG: hypothetical protein J3Q66DRAFT_340529 [Benniella sp.]
MQRLVYKRYLELAVDALKSEDKKIAEDGKKMMEHFKTERAQVDTFWGKPPLNQGDRDAKKTPLHVRLSDVVGPGTKSCDLHLEPLVINGRSISKELMDLRRSYFDGERDLETMDDLLVMNFIFTEKFLREHFSEDIVSKLVPKADIPPLSPAQKQLVTSMVQLAKEKDGMKFKKSARQHSFSDDPLSRLFYELSQSHSLWDYKVADGRSGYTEFNTPTYQWYYVDPFMQSFFRELDMALRRGAAITLPEKYRKAFFLLPMFGIYYHLTLLVVKLTKRDVKERHRAKDERELLFSMKTALDLLMKAKIKDPEVVGFLVRDSSMEIFSLGIRNEALYFPKLLGIMKIPRDHADFECLIEGLPIMLAAQRIVARTLEAVKERVPRTPIGTWPDHSVLDDDTEHPLCRSSFYIED